MTSQEAFKRRIRARMAKTGEKYGAARRVLLTQVGDSTAERSTRAGGAARTREWVAEPMHSDDVIRDQTGRGWDEWCDIIEAFPGHTDGHSAIVEHIMATYDLSGWWSQGITVSWERISGQRLPNQMVDGTFTAGTSRTLAIDADVLRSLLIDDEARADLFPGFETELRSKPTSKSLRVALPPGSALFTIEPQASGKTKVTINHEKLPAFELVEEWKAYWADWLAALDGQELAPDPSDGT